MRFIFLSDAFYNRHIAHKEILQKRNRPYACVAVVVNGRTFAIPMRHHITHKYAYFTVNNAGLDYSKAVVIAFASDIGMGNPTIEQSEYDILRGKESIVRNGLRRYIADYKKALAHPNNPHYKNMIACSALQYFLEYL